MGGKDYSHIGIDVTDLRGRKSNIRGFLAHHILDMLCDDLGRFEFGPLERGQIRGVSHGDTYHNLTDINFPDYLATYRSKSQSLTC